MDLALHGSPTPRAEQRHLPGSARQRPQRPSSGRPPSRNPITGEEYGTNQVQQTSQKPQGIPSLDLGYLREESKLERKLVKDYMDISLDTPNSASTVSWGSSYLLDNKKSSQAKSSKRPDDVPCLRLEELSARPRPPRPVKQPSAWDKEEVVPENIPAPSARQRQMYQQYAQEMRDSYRAHLERENSKVHKDEVDRLVEEMQREPLSKPETAAAEEGEEDCDVFNNSWSQQKLSNKQMLKKLDAEELRDHNMKAKLVETVMIDQLSRAVISDPEQDARQSARNLDTTRRGTRRHLHDSKVSTRSTATEDLLSRRVRFGARILTSNGRDAVRELTGFFFHADNTLTIYEFRKFGKSAKALPFIYRGEYRHLTGPRKGTAYSLADICVGATLTISTSGQQTLPDSLSQLPYIRFRVTDVDEDDKEELLLEGVESSLREETYRRLHALSHQEQLNRQFLSLLQAEVHDQIRKRAIKTRTGLGRYYRSKDEYNTGLLDVYELERGLATYHISLSQEKLNMLVEILDEGGEGSLPYSDYLVGVMGEMSEFRKSLVRKAFAKCDPGKRGYITLSDVKKFFNVNAAPVAPGGDVNALKAFLDTVRQSPKDEEISYLEFEEYYEGLSITVADDNDFRNILRNTWNI